MTRSPGDARSVEDRPLTVERIGPTDGPVLALVFGGIHGDEQETPAAVALLAASLRASPPGAAILCIERANPDGLARGSKDNARGVDLNRNFPSRNWSAAHRPGYFPGASPASEPETRWLCELIETTSPARLVAVHQPFACVNFDGPARALADAMSRACGWPVVEDLGYATPGSFGSRYGLDAGLPVITLELPRPAAAAELARALAALRAACTPDS